MLMFGNGYAAHHHSLYRTEFRMNAVLVLNVTILFFH